MARQGRAERAVGPGRAVSRRSAASGVEGARKREAWRKGAKRGVALPAGAVPVCRYACSCSIVVPPTCSSVVRFRADSGRRGGFAGGRFVRSGGRARRRASGACGRVDNRARVSAVVARSSSFRRAPVGVGVGVAVQLCASGSWRLVFNRAPPVCAARGQQDGPTGRQQHRGRRGQPAPGSASPRARHPGPAGHLPEVFPRAVIQRDSTAIPAPAIRPCKSVRFRLPTSPPLRVDDRGHLLDELLLAGRNVESDALDAPTVAIRCRPTMLTTLRAAASCRQGRIPVHAAQEEALKGEVQACLAFRRRIDS